MKNFDPKRRRLLGLLVSLPTGLAVGLGQSQSSLETPLLNPEESLRKLILFLGPWPAADREEAEDFARRFLQARDAIRPYLPGLSDLVQSLAGRFPDETLAGEEINLRGSSEQERELLKQLVKQLYSFIEVRFLVSNESPWGACQSDRLKYTKAP